MQLRDITFRDLEVFCQVASLRSFSKAAQELGVAQSVASETVKHIETRLQISLLNRTHRPPTLTRAGEVYLEGCRELLEGLRRLEDRVQLLRDKVVGTVTVGAIYSVGLLQMDQYIREFERRYPDAALKIKYLHPQTVCDQVASEQVDIGLLAFAPRRSDLDVTPWQDQEIVVVVSPTHRLARRESLNVRDLDNEDMVTYTPELQFRSETERWLKQARVNVNMVQEFDNVEHIKRAVELGSGFALVPRPTVNREVELGFLRAIPVHGVSWIRPLSIIQRRNRPLTTAAHCFLDLLLQDRTTTTPPNTGDPLADDGNAVQGAFLRVNRPAR